MSDCQIDGASAWHAIDPGRLLLTTVDNPPVLHRSIERMLALLPQTVYVTHFGQLREPQRLGADLRWLIHAHAGLAQVCCAAGAVRRVRVREGVTEIILAQARWQGWRLAETDAKQVFALDIELNAQGPGCWLDASPHMRTVVPTRRRRLDSTQRGTWKVSFPSEKR